jgi:hypothetical protein
MKLGIMQPYFFPYIGYWQLINSVDKYIVYDDVSFINSGWINRNRILINGEDKLINLPLNKASQNKFINEINILDNSIYNTKILKTIECCYKKAPYYLKAFPVIEKIITQDVRGLAQYLEYSIRKICEYLSISTEFIASSTINKNNDLKGRDKIIEICRILDANEYINAIGGETLYSYEDFAVQGIRLRFLKTERIEYKQFKNKFVPNLSIIDVMMFNSIEEIKKMLDKYVLL